MNSCRPGPSSLASQAFRGVAWNVLGTVLRRGIQLGATIVVARLLLPSDYCVAGIATAILGLFQVFRGAGFASALVRERELKDTTVHSVFWFLVLLALVLMGLVMVTAPAVAVFYQQPALVYVLWVLSVGLVLTVAGSVPNALLMRNLRFWEINLVTTTAAIISALLGVLLAVGGLGYWALIVPQVGAGLATALGSFCVARYRPALVLRWQEVRSVGVFGMFLLFSGVNRYLADNADYMILAKFWDPTIFGLYYFAFERARMPFQLISGRVSSVVYPALSSIQQDRDRIRRAFLRGTHALCLVSFPAHMLALLLGDPLVPWVFGEQWRPAVPVFQVFVAAGLIRSIASMVGPTMLAINRPEGSVFFSTFRVIVIVPVLFLLTHWQVEMFTTAVVLLVIWHIQAPAYIAYACYRIGVTFWDLWKLLRRLIAATVGAASAIILVRWVAAVYHYPALTTVLAGSLLAAAVYSVMAWGEIQKQIGRNKPRFAHVASSGS